MYIIYIVHIFYIQKYKTHHHTSGKRHYMQTMRRPNNKHFCAKYLRLLQANYSIKNTNIVTKQV